MDATTPTSRSVVTTSRGTCPRKPGGEKLPRHLKWSDQSHQRRSDRIPGGGGGGGDSGSSWTGCVNSIFLKDPFRRYSIC